MLVAKRVRWTVPETSPIGLEMGCRTENLTSSHNKWLFSYIQCGWDHKKLRLLSVCTASLGPMDWWKGNGQCLQRDYDRSCSVRRPSMVGPVDVKNFFTFFSYFRKNAFLRFFIFWTFFLFSSGQIFYSTKLTKFWDKTTFNWRIQIITAAIGNSLTMSHNYIRRCIAH